MFFYVFPNATGTKYPRTCSPWINVIKMEKENATQQDSISLKFFFLKKFPIYYQLRIPLIVKLFVLLKISKFSTIDECHLMHTAERKKSYSKKQ